MSHKGRVVSIAFDHDGKLLLTASADGAARTWNTSSGAQAAEMKSAREMTCAAFSPDGETIATGSRDGMAQLWSAANGQKLGDPLRHRSAVLDLEFSRDGTLLVTGAEDGTAVIWDAKTGRSLCDSLHHRLAVTQVRFSPDSKRVATAAEDGSARLWDAPSGQPLSEYMRHPKPIRQMLFTSDGKALFTASADHTIHRWDLDSTMDAREQQVLAHFAKAVSPTQLQDSGRLAPQSSLPFTLLQNFSKFGQTRKMAGFFNWFFADYSARQLSPNSRTTVPMYIKARIDQGTPPGLEEAALLAEGAPEILQQIESKQKAKSTP